jgi:hypothetical protein
MTSKEKLIFIGSFIWFLHWGANVTYTLLQRI